jgi:hypothetical protein
MLLNPFCPLLFPFSAAKVAALKATVLLLLTLLIKARVRTTAFSAHGFFLLMLSRPWCSWPSVVASCWRRAARRSIPRSNAKTLRHESQPWRLKSPWRCCSEKAAG